MHHCKKDLQGSTELRGEREGRPGQHSSRGGEMNTLNEKKITIIIIIIIIIVCTQQMLNRQVKAKGVQQIL